jgi:glycosyltransferase involved in cell wall biosynthesis
MKFLFLITHYYPHTYGAELFAQNLAEHLVKKGHQVDLITGRWNSSWKKQRLINGVNVYRVSVIKIRFLQTLLFILPQFLKAKELLGKNNYDFIHAHIFPSLITGALLKTTAKKIITIQGGDLADYPEIYGSFTIFFKKIISLALKKYFKIHVVSLDLKNKVKEISGCFSTIIPNGVSLSTSKVKSIDSKNLKTKYVACSTSRLTEKNNLEETIKAIKIVRDKNIDLGLIIAGTGYQEYQLRQLIDSLKLNEVVKLVGRLSHKKALQLTKQNKIFIRVSLREGFGIAVLEALALKTSVIASLSGGLKDFISHQNAFIPKNHNAPAIAEQIIYCLENPSLVRNKTVCGFKLVKEKYVWPKILSDFTKKIYEIK